MEYSQNLMEYNLYNLQITILYNCKLYNIVHQLYLNKKEL